MALGKQNPTPVTNIIVDLTNVLFIINVRALLKSIGLFNLIWYTLTTWRDLETVCLKFLDTMHNDMPTDRRYPIISYKGYTMPDCLAANLLGLTSSRTVLAEIKKAINYFGSKNYFYNDNEQELVASLMETMFNLDLIKQNMCPNMPLIRFLRSLKKQHQNYKFFLLTNVGHDTYQALLHKYPDVFALFDGSILSADVHELKPYPPIYHALLDTYHLAPAASVFIDDQPENIEAAQVLGLHGIVYKNQRTMEKELATLGMQ